MMYNLFSFKKLLALPKTNNENHAKIISCAYVETICWSICALATSNGYIILCYQEYDEGNPAPIIRQIPWLHHPYKEIKSLCFDPSHKCWLVVVTEDTSLYIVPVLTIVNPYARIDEVWSISDITQCTLTNRRSPPTSVTWWRTSEDEPIGIIGHELGEITFVNLKQLQEIGGTFIPVAVLTLQLVQNEKKNKTFLLITGITETQWLLLLEDATTLFFWPGEADFFSNQSSGYEDRSANICGSQASDAISSFDLQPQRIVKYEGVSRLIPHYTSTVTLLSVVPDRSNQVTLHDLSLKDEPISKNELPANCQQFLVSDKIIFALGTADKKRKLTAISRKLSCLASPDEKKYKAEGLEDAELQHFFFDDTSKIIFVCRIKNHGPCDENDNLSDGGISTIYSQKSCSEPHSSSRKKSGSIVAGNRAAGYAYYYKNLGSDSGSAKSRGSANSNASSYDSILSNYANVSEDLYCDSCSLDGCLVVTQYGLYMCQQRNFPEAIILSLLSGEETGNQSNSNITPNLEAAVKLGTALELNIRHLYEDAADHHLGCGRFTEALKLLQLSKCPQLKRVATFASQGCLAELLTYIRMLFSSNIIDIAAPDRRHFANIIVHCFVHQLLDDTQMNRKKLQKAFWKFLGLNSFYDDDVALRLLVDHGLYDSVYHLVKIHGLHHKMLESLVSSELYSCNNHDIKEALQQLGCQSMFSRFNNEFFLKCISAKESGLILLMNPRLVSSYLSLLFEILPKLKDKEIITRLARVLDFTDSSSKLFLHKVSNKYRKRFKSICSLTSAANETFDFVSCPSSDINIDDIAEAFISCLLRLNQLSDPNHYDFHLINILKLPSPATPSPDEHSHQLQCKSAILSCGAAHAALVRNGCIYTWGKTKNGRLGHNIAPSKLEKMPPKMVGLLLRHRVTVRSVACGARHTLALTSHGVYAWGSSGYGQLGLGNLLRTTQPMMIEYFIMETVVSVVCGQYHSLALTADGRLFSWGWGVHGQLGHGDANNLNHPKLLNPKSIGGMAVQASAGHSHTIVLNGQGDLYSFGCGLFGQLGKGTVNKETHPCKINLPEPVSHVSSGFFHSIALTCSNKLYTWGMNPQTLRLQAQMIKKMRGQKHHLRHQPTLKEIATAEKDFNQSHLVPMLLDTSLIEARIKHVSCGGAHTALLTVDGEVFTWGRNLDGQLGIGSRKEMRTPTLLISINDRRMVEIACGPDYSIALDSTGRLWGWGRNNFGQLGIEDPEPILGMERPPQVAVKVIKIKSTKRTIHLRQNRVNEILKPVELLWLPQSIDSKPKLLETADDDPVSPREQCKICHPIMEVPVLFDVEKPPYGIKTLHLALQVPVLFDVEKPPYDIRALQWALQICYLYVLVLFDVEEPPSGIKALHLALQLYYPYIDSISTIYWQTRKTPYLHQYYNSSSVMHQCLASQNFQATAKVCMLEGAYHKAIVYQLHSLESHGNLDNLAESVCTILNSYISHIDASNLQNIISFVEHVLKFWMKHSLPVDKLESLLTSHSTLIYTALAVILFSSKDEQGNDLAVDNMQAIFKELSADFCFSVVAHVIEQTESGSLSPQYMEQLVGSTAFKLLSTSQQQTTWDSSLRTHDLWQVILQNLGKDHEQAVILPNSAANSLSRSMIAECSSPSPTNNNNSYIDESFVAFTCGHHYTTHQYRTNVVPNFERSLLKLPASIPQTIKLMMAMYNTEGLCPAACPRCSLASLQQELS